jgi:hypothetical protein
MADLYVWLVTEDDGREGPVAVVVPDMGNAAIPLVSANRTVIDGLGFFAKGHARATGKPVRLVRFAEAETLEKL